MSHYLDDEIDLMLTDVALYGWWDRLDADWCHTIWMMRYTWHWLMSHYLNGEIDLMLTDVRLSGWWYRMLTDVTPSGWWDRLDADWSHAIWMIRYIWCWLKSHYLDDEIDLKIDWSHTSWMMDKLGTEWSHTVWMTGAIMLTLGEVTPPGWWTDLMLTGVTLPWWQDKFYADWSQTLVDPDKQKQKLKFTV